MRGAVAVVLMALGCTPGDRPDAVGVASAPLARGEEQELGELGAIDPYDNPHAYPVELVCAAADRCLLVLTTDDQDVLAVAVDERGRAYGEARTIVANRGVHGVHSPRAAAGDGGYAVALARGERTELVEVHAVDLDAGVTLRTQLRVEGDRTAHVEAFYGSGDHWMLYYRSSDWVSGAWEVHEVRIHAPSGTVVSDVVLPAAAAPSEVVCGPTRCLARMHRSLEEWRVFGRGESVLSGAVRTGIGGTLAACDGGFVAVESWIGTRVRHLDLDGLVTRTDVHEERVAAAVGAFSGRERALLVRMEDRSGRVWAAEVRPGEAPTWIEVLELGGPIVATSSGWLVARHAFVLLRDYPVSQIERVSLAAGTLEVTARSDDFVGHAAAGHLDPQVIAVEGGYLVGWTEASSDGDGAALVRVDLDARVTHRAALPAARRHEPVPLWGLALAGDVVGAVIGGTLHRLDARDLTPRYPPEALPVTRRARIVFDGERFVIGDDPAALVRHPVHPGEPPVPVEPGAPPGLSSWHLEAARDGFVLIQHHRPWLHDPIARVRVARWDRARGWRDGTGLERAGVALVGASRSGDALALAVEDERGNRWLTFSDLGAETLSLEDGPLLPERAVDSGVAIARGQEWTVVALSGDASGWWPLEHRRLVGRRLEGGTTWGAPWLVQALHPESFLSSVAGAPSLACQEDGRCLVAYSRWIAEAPYRNHRVRARALFTRGLGGACVGAHECASGHCVDGVCCEDACGGGDSSDCLVCGASGSCEALDDGTRCGPGACGLCAEAACDTEPCADAGGELDAGPYPADGGRDAGARLDGGTMTDSGTDSGVRGVRHGGCTCRVGARGRDAGPTLAALLALLGVLVARRRR